MQFQRQSILIMKESHFLTGVIIHTDWLTFNPCLRLLFHRLLHAIYVERKPNGLQDYVDAMNEFN